jgi:hypothetical protein
MEPTPMPPIHAVVDRVRADGAGASPPPRRWWHPRARNRNRRRWPRCRGQPRGSKKPGESCLKPEKTKTKYTSYLNAHRARPTLWWPPRPTGVAQSKAPSSGFRLARGLTPPSSGFRLARGPAPPSSRFRLARGITSASLEGSSQVHLLPHAGTGI